MDPEVKHWLRAVVGQDHLTPEEQEELVVALFLIWYFWPQIKAFGNGCVRFVKAYWKTVTFSEFRQTLRGNNGRFSPLGVQKPKL